MNMQKSAVVVGGSNGIGLAVAKVLAEKGKHVYIIDMVEPDLEITDEYTYIKCDLLDFNETIFEELALKECVDTLMITSGFGRVADFEYLHTSEIEKLITVNTIGVIKIIRKFYERIKSDKKFYCCVMGSIAGLISSPMFSVYAASKAGICRFIESVNIEIEEAGYVNRILNVCPGSIKGTRFNGGVNDISMTETLAKEIVNHMMLSQTFFIPDYEEVYKGVLERYKTDPYAFGISSYRFKKNSGRAFNEYRVKIGYLSGTFDLFHVGHLNLLRRAKSQCDYLIVGVHPSAAHKGKETFIDFKERKEIVASIKYVDRVVQSCQEDCDAWDLYHYDKLFVGSDYRGTERFIRYEEYFKDKDVEIIYLPYTSSTSSTQIRKTILAKTKDIK